MRNLTAAKAVLALGSLSGAAWAGTSATFTDTQDAVSTFTAGTVDLRLNADTTSSYAFTTLTASNLKPTDTVYAPLTVANAGSLNYTYVMGTSATNADGKALKDTLTLGAKLVANAGVCDSGGVGYAASATTVIASGILSAAAISSRSLAAGASEVLCVAVSLPTGATNTYQGATTTATFTFTATQS